MSSIRPILGKALAPDLNADAKNRAVRTFLQGLAIDLGVAVAALILANVDTITNREGLTLFGITLAKTVVTTVASYVMRRFVDGSPVPTPLPPAPVPEPNDDEPMMPVSEVHTTKAEFYGKG